MRIAVGADHAGTPLNEAAIAELRGVGHEVVDLGEVEVDGGIDPGTAPLAVAAGAIVLVAGTAVFDEREGVAAAMDRLRASIIRVKKAS